jgi:hypothetical protein
MENVIANQKINVPSPASTVNNNGQVGGNSYIYKGNINSHFRISGRKKKSKSERLKVRYKTQEKLVGLLDEVGEEKMSKSMAWCGQRFDVLTCGEHIVSETPNHRCNVRFCALCASRRSGRYKKKYLPYALDFVKLSKVKLTPCLLTLTQKKIKGEKLKHSRERLLKSFRKFIRHSFFDDYFSGGIFTIENTVSESGNHTHLHSIVFRKKFIDHKLLKLQWAKVSEGAENLNIKLIDDLEKGLQECIKYVSKPLDVGSFERKHILELLEVRGKRFIDTFGEFRKFCRVHKLQKEKKEEKQKLDEGQCCSKCNNKDSFLFRVPMTAKQRIEFYENLELVRGSPPILNC